MRGGGAGAKKRWRWDKNEEEEPRRSTEGGADPVESSGGDPDRHLAASQTRMNGGRGSGDELESQLLLLVPVFEGTRRGPFHLGVSNSTHPGPLEVESG